MNKQEKLNKDIKLYFIDLDGTALDTKEDLKLALSKENLGAIKAARSKGIEVIVSTGRMGKGAQRYLDVVGGAYSVQSNGALIKDAKGNTVRELKLSIRQVLLLHSIAAKYNLVFKLDDGLEGYGATTWFLRYITNKFHFNPVPGYFFEMHKERYKMVFWGKLSKSKMEKIRKEMLKVVPEIEAVTSAGGFTIEATAKGATKGEGNKFVANKLGVLPENTAHVGDSMNDSTTVGLMGQLIVMQNGDRKLKALSPYRGPSYKKAGLAKVLNGDYKKIEKK